MPQDHPLSRTIAVAGTVAVVNLVSAVNPSNAYLQAVSTIADIAAFTAEVLKK